MIAQCALRAIELIPLLVREAVHPQRPRFQTGWMGEGRSAAARWSPFATAFWSATVMATTHIPVRRLFRARFPNGTSIQRACIDRVFTHAYLILYARPDARDGYQRGFCSSLDKAEAKVEA